VHTEVVKQVKQRIKSLPYLRVPNLSAYMIVVTDTSNIGYGGILKQKLHDNEQLVCFHSGLWIGSLAKLLNYQQRNFMCSSLYFRISK